MADPKGTKPGAKWPLDSTATPPSSSSGNPPKKQPRSAGAPGAGRVVHDSRGNAVWDWLKETGRAAIESTSAMLKRLEVPGLKMEGEKDDELRIESDRDEGGGYDPYNQRTPTPKGTAPQGDAPPGNKGKPPGRK